MNFKLLPITLTLLAFNSLAATACPEKASNFLDYQRRNSNRCEGIVGQRDIGTGVYLVSFASRKIDNYNQPIRLRIPKVSNAVPNLQVNSYAKNYKLDEIKLKSESAWFSFNWATDILKKAGVPINSLRAVAELPGSQSVYVPVILGKASGVYEIVFYTASRTRFPSFQILNSQQKVIDSQSRRNFSDIYGEVKFNWDGRKTPPGRYQLRYVAEIQERGQPPQKIPTRTVQFEHNPDWLK